MAYQPLLNAQGGFQTYGSDASGSRQPVLGQSPGVDPMEYNLRTLGYGNQKDIAQIGIQPAMQANADRMQRFNALLPILTGQFGRIGQSAPNPNITVGGVYNPQQLQQQVNTMRGQNDQQMATQNRTAQQSLGGRGFGSNSPLLQAIYGQNAASNLGANTQGEQSLRSNVAQMNAKQLLDSQTNLAQQQTERQRNAATMFGSMMSAIGGMI
jgi:hypothetical protein